MMKITRRNFLKATAYAAAVTSATALAACGETPTVESAAPAATPAPTPVPTPTPTPEPPYLANVLTGEPRDAAAPTYRITGVMINNIAGSAYQNARPQRGIGSASVLIEIKVEGGITRFCAVFSDLADMPELGPVRSGRDQFMQLIMPFDGVYFHIGESSFATRIVQDWEYWSLNLGGKNYPDQGLTPPVNGSLYHRDSRGGIVASEHTAFTSGEEVQESVDNAGITMEFENERTFFKFADYRYNEYIDLADCDPAVKVSIHHSDSYRTYFDYNAEANKYMMSQYSSALGANHTTIDELTGEQLGFDNLLCLFTTIQAYPGDSHDVQQADYSNGGAGYYFTNGRVKYIYWFKGSPNQHVYFIDPEGDPVAEYPINMGKTYMTFISLKEYDNFVVESGEPEEPAPTEAPAESAAE